MHRLRNNGDGTYDLLDPNGNAIQSYSSRPSTEQQIEHMLDDLGITSAATREAIKVAATGVDEVMP